LDVEADTLNNGVVVELEAMALAELLDVGSGEGEVGAGHHREEMVFHLTRDVACEDVDEPAARDVARRLDRLLRHSHPLGTLGQPLLPIVGGKHNHASAQPLQVEAEGERSPQNAALGGKDVVEKDVVEGQEQELGEHLGEAGEDEEE